MFDGRKNEQFRFSNKRRNNQHHASFTSDVDHYFIYFFTILPIIQIAANDEKNIIRFFWVRHYRHRPTLVTVQYVSVVFGNEGL